MTQHTYIWFDIGYTAIVTPGEYSVEVEVYKIVGRHRNTPLYEAEVDLNLQVPDLAEAQVFVEGNITWEGCSNWKWNQEDYNVHFCTKEQIADMGIMMARVLEAAPSHIKSLQH